MHPEIQFLKLMVSVMGKMQSKQLLYGFLTLWFLFQFYILLFSESAYGYGGGDNITHFQIARYAFRYPQLFLDLWGKPVYTTLVAPFALFGFHAAKFFNLVVAVATLWLTARISERLYPGSGLFAAILLAFTPVFFHLTPSCLTEVLFAFVLTAAVYLFLHDRFELSAVVLSFIPYVRSEGIVLLPVFAAALLLKRSYRSLIFLAAGTLFYTLIGFVVFGDLFWLVTHSPYSLGASHYGSGSLFHFVRERNNIFGAPLVWLTVAGLIAWMWDVLRGFSLRKPDTLSFILIAGSWITFFSAHSYVWWQGTGASLGLIRVMGGIAPMVVLTAMALYRLVSRWATRKWIPAALFAGAILLQVTLFFRDQKLLLKADPTEQLVRKSADYIRFNEEGKKVWYFNPLVIHYLGLDPYDTKECNWWVPDREQPSNSMEWGDLLVWDAHFGPNEGGVSLENLERDPYLKKVKSFYPVEKITVLGGYDYSVHVFKKSPTKGDSAQVSGSFVKNLSFEGYTDPRVKTEDSLQVWMIDQSQEYGPTMVILPDEFERYEILDVKATVHYKPLESIPEGEVYLVFSAEAGGKNLRYETLDLSWTSGEWAEKSLVLKMAASLPSEAQIKIYVWNAKGRQLMMRNLKTEISSY